MNSKKFISAISACAIGFSVFAAVPEEVVRAEIGDVHLDQSNFPDQAFLEYLTRFDKDGDTYLSLAERDNVKSINVDDLGISTLQGLTYFANLSWLSCSDNSLNSLDLTGMTNLKYVTCKNNELTYFDAARCTELIRLELGDNNLSERHTFNISDSVKLQKLRIENNEFTSLDLGTSYTCLQELICYGNELTSLDVTGLSDLRYLTCSENQLTDVDISGNPLLEQLVCSGNALSSLDVAGHDHLIMLECDYNGLTTLDVSNLPALESLNCHSNRITSLQADNCPSLVCVYCPDNNISSISFQGSGALQYLNMGNNELTGTLDLSGMSNLLQLTCSENDLTGIVADSPVLSYLNMSENNISQFDTDAYPELVILYCSGNPLASLDISANPELIAVEASETGLEYLDIRNNPELINVYENGFARHWPYMLSIPEDAVYLERSSAYPLFDRYAPVFVVSYKHVSYMHIDIDDGVTVLTTDEEYDSYIAAHTQPEEPEEPAQPAPNGGTTPAPSGNGTPTPTPSIPASSSQPVTETGVAGFVERLYTVALGRASDPAGKQDWIDAITMRGETGASCARGFLYSPEFLNKGVSNEEFVAVLYRTFFDREPDQAGFNAWVGVLNNGTSKEEVIEGFINSTEWANLCLFYGIRNGGTGVPNIEIEPNRGTIDFATRLYTTCLARSADEDGLMAWARQLANQRDTGSGAARGFFFSSEFTGQNVSKGEFVTRLYRTFMDREPDQSGFDAWVAQLDSGVSREEVFEGFAQSPEFTRICASYGIIR